MIKITENDILLIIDPQFDFCEGGALAVPGGLAIMPIIQALAEKFRHVVVSQDWHPADHQSFASQHGVEPFSTVQLAYGDQVAWPDHCVQWTPGADFAINTTKAFAIVRKGMNREIDSYSAFFENDQVTPTGMAGLLTSRVKANGNIFIVGLARNYCVGFSALDAARCIRPIPPSEIYVVEDAVAAIPDGTNDAMTEKLINAGVKLITTADIA